jgi:hypothetical protein
LTKASQVPIELHFNYLLQAFPTKSPISADMITFPGSKSLGMRRKIFETFMAFAKWLAKKRYVAEDLRADIVKPKVLKRLMQ